MREEKVTINILKWLELQDWEILCYDFPQSGTGTLLHPNDRDSKNKGGVIPDIIAKKKGYSVFFENKDRYFFSDFVKLEKIKSEGKYTTALERVIYPNKLSNLFFGIGIYSNKSDIDKSLDNMGNLDFLVSVKDDGLIDINFDRGNIFL